MIDVFLTEPRKPITSAPANSMPHRSEIATQELARLLNTLSHRHRIQIVEELRLGEQDVTSLSDILKISASRVSQHLSLLRSHHIVKIRREGRHVFYRLASIGLATWLAEGLQFVETEMEDISSIHDAVEHTKAVWLDEQE